jgi:hypothetical protein
LVSTVIYSQELEPITVLNVPVEMMDHIEASGWGRALVKPKNEDDPPEYLVLQQRVLQSPSGLEFKFLYTHQEVLALGLAPEQLPGQKQLYQYMRSTLEKQRDIIKRQTKIINELRNGGLADDSGA